MRLRITVAAGLVSAMGLASEGALAGPRSYSPQAGLTFKTDLSNSTAVSGAKLDLANILVLEAYYLGLIGHYTGYGARILYLIPFRAPPEGGRLQPYLGAGYAEITDKIRLFEGGDLRLKDRPAGPGVNGSVAVEGRGIQIIAGIRANPLARLPRLFFEIELVGTLFKVSDTYTVELAGVGAGNDPVFQRQMTVESDFNRLSIIFGATYYLF
jgi:hypothetical protein